MEREKKKRIYFQPFNNPYHQTDSELHTTICKNTIKCSREEATAQHWRCTVAISAGVQIRAGFNTIRQNYIKKCDTRSCYFAKKTWIAPFREDSFLLLFGSIFDGVLHSGLAAPQLLKRGHQFSFGRQVFLTFFRWNPSHCGEAGNTLFLKHGVKGACPFAQQESPSVCHQKSSLTSVCAWTLTTKQYSFYFKSRRG